MSKRKKRKQIQQRPAERISNVNSGDPGVVYVPVKPRANNSDPLSGFEPNTSTNSDRQAGAISGSTPMVLARELDDFYAGRFRAASLRWERFERVHNACLAGRGKRMAKVLAEAERWEVDPLDDSPQAEEQAEFLRDFYHGLRAEKSTDAADRGGFLKALEFALDATGKEYSFQACDWRRTTDGIRLYLRHHPLWFFERRNGKYLYSLGMNETPYLPVIQGEWLSCSRGRGVMESASALVIYQRLPFRQLAELLEKYGIPQVYGRDPNAMPDSPGVTQLMDALAAITSGWYGVITGQAEIKELTTNLKGEDSMHLAFSDYCDDWIVSTWMGGALSTRAKSGTGTLAGGAQADDTASLIDGDLAWLQDVFNDQISRLAVELQFGKGTPLLAALRLERFDPARRKSRREDAKAGVDLGLRIPARFLHGELDLPVADENEEYLLTLPSRQEAGMQPPF